MDRAEDRIALIELIERDGRVGRVIDVHHWPLSLGRGLDSSVVLDDPHVAAVHATLRADEQGQVWLNVGASDNGVLVDGQRLPAGRSLALPAGGALLQLGATRLRLRLRGEQLAPERRLIFTAVRPAQLAWQAGLIGLLMGVRHWVGLDPGAGLTAWLPLLVGLPLALVGWCGAWALASKLFQHRFDFWGHARIVLPWVLAIEVGELLLPQLGGALGWPLPWQLVGPFTVLMLALMLRAQLAHLLPQQGRIVAATVAGLTLAYAGVTVATQHRSTDRILRGPYMSTLPLPPLRLGGSVPPQAMVEAMAPLRDQLAERAQQARDDEAEADAGTEE